MHFNLDQAQFEECEFNALPEYTDISGWSVMPHKCPTCPFQEDEQGRYRDPAIVARVQDRLLEGSQTCHHPRLYDNEETHLCRGARDWQIMIFHRLGILREPTDACWNKYLEQLHQTDLVKHSPVGELADIVSFGKENGIDIEITTLETPGEAFLHGVWIEQGRLCLNPLLVGCPGDVLHEMGHFAVSPSSVRPLLFGNLELDDETFPHPFLDDGITENPAYRRLIDGDEYAAIAWSYAAAVHLGINVETMQSEESVKGDWQGTLAGLKLGAYAGINNLQHIGMSKQKLFPTMLRWIQI